MSPVGEIYTVALRGNCESPQWVMRLGLDWVQAQQQGAGLRLEPPRDFQPWLTWLGLPLAGEAGPAREAPWSPPPLPADRWPTLTEVRQRGVLPEMLISYLIQLAWTPQARPSCRPLFEIVKLFEPVKVGGEVRPFDWEELMDINSTRLQELTPRELVACSQEFWPAYGGPSSPGQAEEDLQLLEAWSLLFVEHYRSLHDVARHLCKFWYHPTTPPSLDLPHDWTQQLELGALELDPRQQEALLLALTGEALGEVAILAPLLGSERCAQRVLTRP